MDIVNRIVSLADKNGITGADLGKALNLKKSPLTDWKNGKSKPTLDQIMMLCEFFAVPSDYILFGKSEAMDKPANDIIDLKEDEKEIVSIWRELDYENKTIIKGDMYKLRKEQRSLSTNDTEGEKRLKRQAT